MVAIDLPPRDVMEPSGVLENLSHRVWMSCASDVICSAFNEAQQLQTNSEALEHCFRPDIGSVVRHRSSLAVEFFVNQQSNTGA